MPTNAISPNSPDLLQEDDRNSCEVMKEDISETQSLVWQADAEASFDPLTGEAIRRTAGPRQSQRRALRWSTAMSTQRRKNSWPRKSCRIKQLIRQVRRTFRRRRLQTKMGKGREARNRLDRDYGLYRRPRNRNSDITNK